MAGYLYAAGAIGEAKSHQLAVLVYHLATGLDPSLSLRSLTLRIRQSAALGETFTFPPLADLLSLPAFSSLRTFLTDRTIPPVDLQPRIDALVAQVRAAVTAAPVPSE
jgi:hypothetical protein